MAYALLIETIRADPDLNRAEATARINELDDELCAPLSVRMQGGGEQSPERREHAERAGTAPLASNLDGTPLPPSGDEPAAAPVGVPVSMAQLAAMQMFDELQWTDEAGEMLARDENGRPIV